MRSHCVYLFASLFGSNVIPVMEPPHSARVVNSTSLSDVTLWGPPTLGPYERFPDVLLRPDIRRTLFVRLIRTRRRCNVFSTSATNKEFRKTYIRAQNRTSAQRPWTSCRVGIPVMEPPISIGKLGQWLKNGRDGLKVCITQCVGLMWFFGAKTC